MSEVNITLQEAYDLAFSCLMQHGCNDENAAAAAHRMIQAEGDPQAMAALKVARNVYEQSGFKAISGTGSSSFVMENGITRNAKITKTI